MLSLGLSLTSVAVRGGGGQVSAAALMLASESQGLALDFTDDAFLSSTGLYGSARVKDTGTPANNYDSHPFGLVSYSSPSPKLCLGPEGTLRYGAHNLILQSEDFTTTWQISVNNTEVIANAAIAPDGSLSADLFRDKATTSVHNTFQTFTGAKGADYAFTVKCRQEGKRYVHVQLADATASTKRYAVLVDLADGSVAKTYQTNTPENGSHAVAAADNGFWAITVRMRMTTGGSCFAVISLSNSANPSVTASNEPIYIGDGTGVYIWGAHVRRLPSDDTYLKTTSAAVYELPYEWDTSGNLLGVSFEPRRTNLFLDNRSPVTQDVTVTAVAHTLSFYGTGSITLSGVHADTLNGTGANDRVTLTFTPTAGTLTCTVSGTIDYVQVEAGAFATSPIVTAGSTVTRAADDITLATSKFPFDSASGSIYLVVEGARGAAVLYEFNDGTASERNLVWRSGSNLIFQVVDGGEAQTAINFGTLSDARHQVATAWASNDFAACLDGGVVGTDTSGTIPTPTRLRLGADDGGGTGSGNGMLSGYIRRLLYVPRRMTNAELQTLTAA